MIHSQYGEARNGRKKVWWEGLDRRGRGTIVKSEGREDGTTGCMIEIRVLRGMIEEL